MPVAINYKATSLSNNSRKIVGEGGVASGIAPTGSVGDNGALTLGTALANTYDSGIWLYFPADAIFAGSTAGSYWCVMSSTTLGTIYAEQLSGLPTRVSNPTALVSTGPGAYTGYTSNVTLASVTIPGGSMGTSGALIVNAGMSVSNTAGSKSFKPYLGGVLLGGGVTYTTVVGAVASMTVRNMGVSNRQFSQSMGRISSPASATTPSYTTIDTTTDQVLQIVGTLAVTTDVITLDSFLIEGTQQ